MSTSQEHYKIYLRCLEKAKGCETPNYGYELYLMRELTGNKFGKGFSERMGESIKCYDVLSSLERPIKYELLCNLSFDENVDWSQKNKDIKENYINLMKDTCAIIRTKTLLIEKRIKELKDEAITASLSNKNLIEEIEEIANKMHSEECTKDWHVYHLYSDGSITSQKGGDIYLQRSEFMMHSEMILPPLSFPIKTRDELSYIIGPEKELLELRNKMQQLSI